MAKIHDIAEGYHAFWCPGCNRVHAVHSFGGNANWEFNGDNERPTISPSIKVEMGNKAICHSFVTDGKIQFLSDCTHELVGQTVEIPDWEE